MDSISMTNQATKAQLINTKFNEQIDLEYANQKMAKLDVTQRVEFALNNLPENFALASSFGAQSAVSLHLLTQVYPDIPIILVDTGYLFTETYQFIDELTERLKLNIQVYRSDLSSRWQEARFGKLWDHDDAHLQTYNQMNKIEPMERALTELNIATWFSGLRRSQAQSRASLPYVQLFKNRMKVHPILDWNNQQLHKYLKKHHLPYHPLWDKGYVSIGDIHSTVPLTEGMLEEETRFGGRQRECGIHVDSLSGL